MDYFRNKDNTSDDTAYRHAAMRNISSGLRGVYHPMSVIVHSQRHPIWRSTMFDQ